MGDSLGIMKEYVCQLKRRNKVSVLSNGANYNMDDALNEINQKKLLLDTKVETQLILQLLVQKGIITREKVSEKGKE